MAQVQQSHPNHLDPSELGTKEYWDNYYQNDLDNHDNDSGDDGVDDTREEAGAEPLDPSELESWFDDVGAPAKTLAFLTDESFPLSPTYLSGNERAGDHPTVLDLGTGNGSALFSLHLEGGYVGRLVGVDYSQQSIELARRLWRQYQSSSATTSATNQGEISFEILDLIHNDPKSQPWWPSLGFDLVLDKGTFDAISLSSSTIHDQRSNSERRICELYPAKVSQMAKPGGFLLVTSCNWTEDELVRWFTATDMDGEGVRLEVYGRIKYPIFEFGGQKGQGVASVCFRRVDGATLKADGQELVHSAV